MTALIIVIILAVLIAIWCVSTVNDFKKKEIRVQEGLSGVEVALTKRYDMLTKMLDTAKGYMEHENELFTKVIELRRGMSFVPLRYSRSFSMESETRKSICRRRADFTTHA